MLAPIASTPALAADIAFIQLRNEMPMTDSQAIAWATSLAPVVKQSVPSSIPLTLAVADYSSPGGGLQNGLYALATAPVTLTNNLDFFDYHYYHSGNGEQSFDTLQKAMTITDTLGKPLFIGETGYSTITTTVSSVPPYTTTREAWQDHFDRSVEYSTEHLGLPLAAPWVLYDFPPGSGLPYSNPAPEQDYYGLLRTDTVTATGNITKPAFTSMGKVYGSGLVDLTFNNGFDGASVMSGTTLFPGEWQFQYPVGGYGLDPTGGISNTAAVTIGNNATYNTYPSFYTFPINAHVIPGRVYTATVWAREDGSTYPVTPTTRIQLTWYGADPSPVTGTNYVYISSNRSQSLDQVATDPYTWTQLIVSGTAPLTATEVEIQLQSYNNPGTARFDNVDYDTGSGSGTYSSPTFTTTSNTDSYTFTASDTSPAIAGSCVNTTGTAYLTISNNSGVLASGDGHSYCSRANTVVSAGQTYTVTTVITNATSYRSAWSINGSDVHWSISGSLGSGGSQTFSFPVLSPGPISLTGCDATGTLSLLDANSKLLASATAPGAPNCQVLSYDAATPDLYRFKESGSGSWSGTITTK